MPKIIACGIKKGANEQELSEKIKQVFLESTNSLSWLKANDKVLLKPAINSFYPHPSTTHPLAIKVVAETLAERGAEVIVGDQSGVEHVVRGPNGVAKGSSKECYQKATGDTTKNIRFVGFEERGWDGYSHFSSPQTSAWSDGFYHTKLIQEVDHIINLPRISTHVLAGVTLGLKNMVGILRLDSRKEFHADGSFYPFVKYAARKGQLPEYGNANKFFEKMTEISLAISKKLRLTLFVATKAQVTLGPDKYLFTIGKTGLLPAKVIEPDTGLILAGDNPASTEAAAIAYLTMLYQNTSLADRLFEKFILWLGGQVQELGKQSVWENPFVKHALILGLGEKQTELDYLDMPDETKQKMVELLKG